MKGVINDQIVLLRAPEGPLVVYLDRFASATSKKGYAVRSVHRQVFLAADFSRWLKQEGINLRGMSNDCPKQYLQYRYRQLQPDRGDLAALGNLMDFLRLEGVIRAEKKSVRPATEAERCVQDYEEHLREMCGLSTGTIKNYVRYVRSFLQHRFGGGQVTFSHLSASDVVGFVQHQAPGLHRTAKTMTTALRTFLRYVHYRSEGTLNLVAAVPVVANWSDTSVPRAISADQVHQLLASIDRSTAIGRRDYAILLLLARLGLRASEVVILELDNIDWNAGTMNLRTKGGMCNEFPLLHEVGEAIVDYLRHGRPMSNSRRVFLRSKAPIQGFRCPSSVGSVVHNCLQRAGVNAPSFGAHQFRHGLATEMLRQGASFSEIGDVLGHRHPQTTRIYAKVDLEALRTLALPWPGGAR